MDKVMSKTLRNLNRSFIYFMKGLGIFLLCGAICVGCIYSISFHPRIVGYVVIGAIVVFFIVSAVVKAHAEAIIEIKREETIKKSNERIKEYCDKKQEEMIAKHINSLTSSHK